MDIPGPIVRLAFKAFLACGLVACQGLPNVGGRTDSTVASTAVASRVPAAPLPTPTIQNGPKISGLLVSKVTNGSATISWTTNRPASSQVMYGATPSYGASTAPDRALTLEHSQVIGGLTPKTRVEFQVVSADTRGTTASAGRAFTTLAAPASAGTEGEWSSVLQWPLVDVHMSLLYTGELLMWDAWEFNGTPSTRLWNPNSLTFIDVPTALSQMFCADETMLPDGRLLVSGGHNGADIGIKTVMIFDPKSRTWTRAADMNTSRWYPITLALPTGRVLALGGEITNDNDANVPEEYDPASNSWLPLSRAALDVGEYPDSYLLPDGRIFMSAGPDGQSRTLDVDSQVWTTVGANPVPTGTSVMYRPGKVLASGGGTGGSDPVQTVAATIDLTSRSPAWQVTAPMIYPRIKHNLVVLPDGSVLAVGGSTQFSLVSTTGVLPAELWNPITGTWTILAQSHDLRMYHSTATLLPDGRVLVAGGGRLPPATDFQTAEIYSPPYLFRGPRPTLASAPDLLDYGVKAQLQSSDASQIGTVALIRLPSNTHAYDSDQRYVELRFRAAGQGLEIDAPNNASLAPPGFYMLFVVDKDGVPSVGKIVQIGQNATPVAPPRTTPGSGSR